MDQGLCTRTIGCGKLSGHVGRCKGWRKAVRTHCMCSHIYCTHYIFFCAFCAYVQGIKRHVQTVYERTTTNNIEFFVDKPVEPKKKASKRQARTCTICLGPSHKPVVCPGGLHVYCRGECFNGVVDLAFERGTDAYACVSCPGSSDPECCFKDEDVISHISGSKDRSKFIARLKAGYEHKLAAQSKQTMSKDLGEKAPLDANAKEWEFKLMKACVSRCPGCRNPYEYGTACAKLECNKRNPYNDHGFHGGDSKLVPKTCGSVFCAYCDTAFSHGEICTHISSCPQGPKTGSIFPGDLDQEIAAKKARNLYSFLVGVFKFEELSVLKFLLKVKWLNEDYPHVVIAMVRYLRGDR